MDPCAPQCWALIPVRPPAVCVILSMSLNLLVPQFPHLRPGDNEATTPWAAESRVGDRQAPTPGMKNVAHTLLLFPCGHRPWKLPSAPPSRTLACKALRQSCRGSALGCAFILDPSWPALGRQGAGPRHRTLLRQLPLLVLLFLGKPGRGWVLISISQVWLLLGPGPGCGPGAGVGPTHREAQRALGEGRAAQMPSEDAGPVLSISLPTSCACSGHSLDGREASKQRMYLLILAGPRFQESTHCLARLYSALASFSGRLFLHMANMPTSSSRPRSQGCSGKSFSFQRVLTRVLGLGHGPSCGQERGC